MPGRWLEPRYLYCAAMPFCALSATMLRTLYVRGRATARGLVVAAVACIGLTSLGFELVLERKVDRLGRRGAIVQEKCVLDREVGRGDGRPAPGDSIRP